MRIFCLLILLFLFIKPTHAATIAEQTTGFTDTVPVWQLIQELGDNLSGNLKSFTFRVSNSLPLNQQFDFTAQNTFIFDKTTNTRVANGCVTFGFEPSNRLRGLTFNTNGVPDGFTDVIIDFACNNFTFITGHRYLIKITNANICSGCIKFAGALYGAGGSFSGDFFTGGGLRWASGNIFDTLHGGAICNPINYIWNDPILNPASGCHILTTSRDDIYFILKDIVPDPAPPEKTPLILIPGIGGSELKVAEDTFWSKPDGHGGTFTHAYPKDDKVWVNETEAAKPGDDDYFDILRMKPDGVTPESNLELTGNLFPGAYQGMIDFFINNGYELNKTLFIFPYDWRKDLSSTAPLLNQKISQIKTQTNSQKVDIVSHSMGGLVARNYIADSTRASNIRKLFTLGTPHLGSVDYIKKLMYGDCLTKSIVFTKPVCVGLAASEMRDVLQNMIGGYELAPAQLYFSFYSGEDNEHPYPLMDNSGPLNYVQIKSFLTNSNYNTSLFTPSELFHNLDNSLSNTNGVALINITGSGITTLGQIIEKKIVNFSNINFTKKDSLNINGDDTVPLFSASLNDSLRNLSLSGNSNIYYTKQNHGALPASGPALQLVKNYLEDNTELPSGISTQPFQLNGNQLSVHSPVNIHAYDELGNHTGPTPDGNFEENIPGSSYQTLDDAKFIWLPEDGIYNIVFESTGEGSFDFKIRKFDNDLNTKTFLYKDIPLQPDSSGQTQFDTLSIEPPILEIDSISYNNFSTLSGDANYDYTDPIASFDVNPKIIWPPNGKMVDININGTITDENPYLTTITVDDEYHLVEPTLTTYYETSYNQIIQINASRRDDDLDGRRYIIKILVQDLAGNEARQQFEVVIPHDQREK